MMSEIIPTIAASGSGADLCTLPLVVISVLLFSGVQPVANAQLEWMTSPWFLAAALLIVGIEFCLDETIGKQEGARELWKKIQHVLTAFVVIVVTIAMSHKMEQTQMFQAMIASFVVTNVIKAGIVDRVKSAWTLVSGGV